jgi:transposase
MAHEKQIAAIWSSACHTTCLGSFPTPVSTVHGSPHLHTLNVSLYQARVLPTARRCAPRCGCQIVEQLMASHFPHAHETGLRLSAMPCWLHANGARVLTHLTWHAPRRWEAVDEIGSWPRSGGRGMHDRCGSSDAGTHAHRICGAHMMRECAAVAQQGLLLWATEVARSFEILAVGSATHPPPPGSAPGKRKGKPRQRTATTLLNALLVRAE